MTAVVVDGRPVPAIHPWVIHLARADDEWAARCGADEKGMLVAEAKDGVSRWLLIGYKMCEKCEADLDAHGR